MGRTMITSDKTVLVTGATGNQGGATARHLLADGWQVRALVRDPAAPAARALADAGAELAIGDLADRASLEAAVKGVYGVFSVQAAGFTQESVSIEVRQGNNIADAARSADVQHFVYTSVGGADRQPRIPSWLSKAQIEQHIATLDMPTTILRPVMFMENHASQLIGVLSPTALIRMIEPGQRVQLIAVRDIGAFAALAFGDPDTYVGKAFELAGDELTGTELVAKISASIGRELNVEPLSDDVLAVFGQSSADIAANERFGGWQADIPALRRLHPGLLTLDDWLATDGKASFAALLHT